MEKSQNIMKMILGESSCNFCKFNLAAKRLNTLIPKKIFYKILLFFFKL